MTLTELNQVNPFYYNWFIAPHGSNGWQPVISLDGFFTVEDLEIIVSHIKEHGYGDAATC